MELTQEQQQALKVLIGNKTSINLDQHFEEELERIKDIEVEIRNLMLELNGDFRYDFTTTSILNIARQLVDLDDERNQLEREIRKAKGLLADLGVL